MHLLVNRTASRIAPYMHHLFPPSGVSSRPFSIGPDSPFGVKLPTSLGSNISVKPTYKFENITNNGSNSSYWVHLAIASIVAFLTSCLKTGKAEESSETAAAKEAAAIAEKHGELWECIGRTPDIFGGYIYHYKLRKEFDEFSYEKIEQIFPALEPQTFRDILAIISMISQGRFKKLGYSTREDATGVYLDIPDKEALEGRFENLRKVHSGLKPLKIFSSEGVADDLAFILAYLNYDVLLSSGKEFIHDHFAHILPTLNLMLSYPEEYAVERDRIRGIIAYFLSRIIILEQMSEKDGFNDLKNQLPKLKTALGIAVDTLSAIPLIGVLEDRKLETFADNLFDLIEETRYREYWKKKFGEKFKSKAFAIHWERLANLEKPLAEESKIQATDIFAQP